MDITKKMFDWKKSRTQLKILDDLQVGILLLYGKELPAQEQDARIIKTGPPVTQSTHPLNFKHFSVIVHCIQELN
eukprot:3460810-Ditylum_brightwellii.AAC.1